MRCVRNFLCQFGLAGALSRKYGALLPDDPQWLPEGPRHRKNEMGTKRFAQGYLSYAGSGNSSRSNQFFVALEPNGPLGGGSPWEVPWGELVGDHSYRTLSRISTVYGEDGPSQGALHREGGVERAERDFPELDFILSCRVVEERMNH